MRGTRTAGILLVLGAMMLPSACAPEEQPPAPEKLTEQELTDTAEVVRRAVAAVDGVAEARVWYHYAPPAGQLTLEVSTQADDTVEVCEDLAEAAGRAAVEAVADVEENPAVSLRVRLAEPVECHAAWSPSRLDEAAAHYGITRR